MAKALLPDDLWAPIQPLLPVPHPYPKGGRPRIDDRAALTGILFVLKAGLRWEYLPRELGCGSGMSCWRCVHAWQQAGVWQRRGATLQHLREYDQIQWERASVDSASVPSPLLRTIYRPESQRPQQARMQAPSARRTTRLPLMVSISAVQVHDSRILIPLLETVPSVGALAGRPRKRPAKLYADKAYASQAHDAWLRSCGIVPRIPPRQRASRKTSIGGSSYAGLAATFPPIVHSLRLPCRYPKGIALACQRTHLPEMYSTPFQRSWSRSLIG